jgi:hypothetical protein
MSAKIYFIDPAELLLQPTDKKSPFVNRETKPCLARASYFAKDFGKLSGAASSYPWAGRPIRPISIVVPEERLWKMAQSPFSAKLAIVEFAFLLLVLAVTTAAIIGSFTELFHLIQTDVIGHFAEVMGA